MNALTLYKTNLPRFTHCVRMCAFVLCALGLSPIGALAESPPSDQTVPIADVHGSTGSTVSGSAANLIDEDLTTAWESTHPKGETIITVDLGRRTDVREIWLYFDDLSKGYQVSRILAANGVDGGLGARLRGAQAWVKEEELAPTSGEGSGWVKIPVTKHNRRQFFRIFTDGNQHGPDPKVFNLAEIAVVTTPKEAKQARLAALPWVMPDPKPTDYLDVSVDPAQMGLKEQPPSQFDREIVIDQTGSISGAYTTVKEGIEAAIEALRQGQSTRVQIHPGIYREAVPHIAVFNPDAYRREIPVPEDKRAGNEAMRQAWLVIEGTEPGKAVISGADELRNWTQLDAAELSKYGLPADANVWSHPWPHNLRMNAGNLGRTGRPQGNNAQPVESHRREMLFVEGKRYQVRLAEEFSYEQGMKGGLSKYGNWTYEGFVGPKHLDSPGTFAVAEMGPDDTDVTLFSPETPFSELYAQDGERPHDILWARFEPGMNPNDKGIMVEAAVRDNLFWSLHKNNLVLRNLVFEKAAVALSGDHDLKERYPDADTHVMVCFGIDGDRYGNRIYGSSSENLLIDSCVFRQSAGHASRIIGYRQAALVNSVFEDNGSNSFGAAWTTDFLFRGNRLVGNNWRDVGMGDGFRWQAASPKVILLHTAAFTDNLFEDNYGHGLWFDEGPTEILIERNILRGNKRSDLMLELSPGPFYVINNVLDGEDSSATMLHYVVGLRTTLDGQVQQAGGTLLKNNLLLDSKWSNIWFTFRRDGGMGVTPEGNLMVSPGKTRTMTMNFASIGNIFVAKGDETRHMSTLGGPAEHYEGEIMQGKLENNRYYHAHGGPQAFHVPEDNAGDGYRFASSQEWQELGLEEGSRFYDELPPVPEPKIEVPEGGAAAGHPVTLTLRKPEGSTYASIEWFHNGTKADANGMSFTFTPERTGYEAVVVRVENEEGIFYLDQALIPVME